MVAIWPSVTGMGMAASASPSWPRSGSCEAALGAPAAGSPIAAAGAALGDAAVAAAGAPAGAALGSPREPRPWRRGALAPTIWLSSSSMESKRCSVETGRRRPPSSMDPDGMVIWLAKRMPCTCCSEMPCSAILAGSSTMSRMGVAPPVSSAVETPSMPSRAGHDLVAGDGGRLDRVGALHRTDGGDDDGLAVEVEGADLRLDALGQLGLADGRLDVVDGLLEVGAEVELGEDERQRVGGGRLDRLEARHVGHGSARWAR